MWVLPSPVESASIAPPRSSMIWSIVETASRWNFASVLVAVVSLFAISVSILLYFSKSIFR